MTQVYQLCEEVSGLGLVLGLEDWWSWKGNVPPDFSMKSAYSHLRGEGKGDFSYFYNLFGKCKVLPVAQVLAWRVLENKIATKVNLVRRGVVVDNIICCLCRVQEESTNNLFFGFKTSWLVWNQCLSWLGLVSAVPIDAFSNFI